MIIIVLDGENQKEEGNWFHGGISSENTKKKTEKLKQTMSVRKMFRQKIKNMKDSFLFPLFIFSRCYWCPGGSHKANWRKLYIYIYAPPLNRYSDDYNLFSKRAHFPTSWEYFSKKDRETQSSHKLVTGRHAWDTFSVWGWLCVHRDPESSAARERVHSCIIIYDVLKSRVETKKKKKPSR
jgi:hypothetical protein